MGRGGQDCAPVVAPRGLTTQQSAISCVDNFGREPYYPNYFLWAHSCHLRRGNLSRAAVVDKDDDAGWLVQGSTAGSIIGWEEREGTGLGVQLLQHRRSARTSPRNTRHSLLLVSATLAQRRTHGDSGRIGIVDCECYSAPCRSTGCDYCCLRRPHDMDS